MIVAAETCSIAGLTSIPAKKYWLPKFIYKYRKVTSSFIDITKETHI